MLLSACGKYTPPSSGGGGSSKDNKPPRLQVAITGLDDSNPQKPAANEVRLEAKASDEDGISKVVFQRTGMKDTVLTQAPYIFTDFVDTSGKLIYTVTAYDTLGSTTTNTIETTATFPKGIVNVSAKLHNYQIVNNQLLAKPWQGDDKIIKLYTNNLKNFLTQSTLATTGDFDMSLAAATQQINKQQIGQSISNILKLTTNHQVNCQGNAKFNNLQAKVTTARLKIGQRVAATGSYVVSYLNDVPQSNSKSEGILLHSDKYIAITGKQICAWPSNDAASKAEVNYAINAGAGWHFLNINLTDQGPNAQPRYKLVISNGNWNNNQVLYGWGLDYQVSTQKAK